jgi:hypothetical protein
MEFSLFLSPSLGFTKEEKNTWHDKMRRTREKKDNDYFGTN